MTPNEMRDVYIAACDVKGYEVNDGQLALWKRIMGHLEKRDLMLGLDSWYAHETNFPMPVELKPLAELARRIRINRISEAKELVRWKCTDCGIYRSGFISPEDQAERRCQGIPKDGRTDTDFRGVRICGAVMSEIFREPQLIFKNARG